MAVLRLPALLSLLAVAGCGEAAAPAAEPSAPAVPAATATATPTPVASAAVAIEDFEYTPRVLRVARGTRVTWTDHDEANHSVTFRKGPGDLGNIRQGGTRSATFSHAGTYTYVCVYHPSMRARIVVRVR
jgi:plastocyanin